MEILFSQPHPGCQWSRQDGSDGLSKIQTWDGSVLKCPEGNAAEISSGATRIRPGRPSGTTTGSSFAKSEKWPSAAFPPTEPSTPFSGPTSGKTECTARHAQAGSGATTGGGRNARRLPRFLVTLCKRKNRRPRPANTARDASLKSFIRNRLYLILRRRQWCLRRKGRCNEKLSTVPFAEVKEKGKCHKGKRK